MTELSRAVFEVRSAFGNGARPWNHTNPEVRALYSQLVFFVMEHGEGSFYFPPEPVIEEDLSDYTGLLPEVVELDHELVHSDNSAKTVEVFQS